MQTYLISVSEVLDNLESATALARFRLANGLEKWLDYRLAQDEGVVIGSITPMHMFYIGVGYSIASIPDDRSEHFVVNGYLEEFYRDIKVNFLQDHRLLELIYRKENLGFKVRPRSTI